MSFCDTGRLLQLLFAQHHVTYTPLLSPGKAKTVLVIKSALTLAQPNRIIYRRNRPAPAVIAGMNAQCSTWHQWEEFLELHIRRLFHFEAKDVFGPIKDYSEFKSFIIRLDQQHCKMVERAIRKFCDNNRWPPLNPCQKYLLKRRLEFAKRCCISARCKKPKAFVELPPPDAGRAAVLKALVIDGWNNQGFGEWKHSLHAQWLQVLAGNVSQDEWSEFVKLFQQRRVLSLIAHVRSETSIDASPQTFKQLDYYFQCADGSRWKGHGVGIFPNEIGHIQHLFNNNPEDFEQLLPPPWWS